MDVLYEPHDQVQVVMLRGLFGKWKQPIYYQFDDKHMEEKLVDIIIKNVEQAGYPVVAPVHDLGPTNLRVWKHFKIDPVHSKKTSFKNPCADREVFIFADAPHMIKLIRNNFINSGFFLKNEDFVSDACIREMLMKTKTEYGLAYKLDETHLNVSGHQRQRVKFAVQLLSKSCANSLKYLGERGLLETKNWRETAEFISFVNDWFDVMNSCGRYGDIISRNAFGMNEDSQAGILQRMIDMMLTMRVKHQNSSLYKFQKGVVASCRSLMGLFDMLKKLYNISYIKTRRLNQDCLESFFGCIRQMSGPHDHPDSLSFKYRLKKFLLGRDIVLLSDKTNTCNMGQNHDPVSSALVTNTGNNESESGAERKLALEICLTSMFFKNLDFVLETENDSLFEEIAAGDQENVIQQRTQRR